jgi:pSer/pThr/pTyr-binding forkhead associated (FHA) protein
MNSIPKKFNSILKKLKYQGGGTTIKLEFTIDGSRKEYIFEMEGLDIILGRSNDSDVVIENDSVSRTHVRLWYESGVLWAQDLGSKNGTYVADKKIDTKHKVNDEITVGSVNIKIQVLNGNCKEDNESKFANTKNLFLLLISGIFFTIIGMGIIILALFYSFL